MKAANNFLQVQLKVLKGTGFEVTDGQLSIGIVVSVGDNTEHIKKGYEVLFDKFKTLVYSINGVDNYFVKEETILAYEK